MKMKMVTFPVGFAQVLPFPHGNGALQSLEKLLGGLMEIRIVFSIDLLEQSKSPASFIYSSALSTLELDISLNDKDFDGIFDDYEQENGLNETRNDSNEDKDHDGLSNLTEYS